ncbi:MAG TPA: antibiotic biosynthesis monooxygenase family protein [Gaiellaceae bacterium]|nr:antibiotic biosynthesis monooxygenase family protein [Gaiellaceae bacterium]
MIYSSGVWTVKEGKEDEFRRTWEANVTLVPADNPGVVFRLFRDVGQPRRYVSIVGPWKSLDALAAVRSAPEFQQSMERAMATLESVEVLTYEVVVEVS